MTNHRIATYSAGGKLPTARSPTRASPISRPVSARTIRRCARQSPPAHWRNSPRTAPSARRIMRSTPSPGSRRSRRRKRSSASASTIPTATPNTRTARTRRNIPRCSCARRAPSSAITRRSCGRAPRRNSTTRARSSSSSARPAGTSPESDALDHIAARDALQRRHDPRLGAACQVQRHAGQEFRFHRQPRAVARALHRRSADRRHPPDHQRQRRDCGRRTAPRG